MDLGRIIFYVVVAWIILWALNHGAEVASFFHSFVNSTK
jgi:hypothetical protein